ncbi:MAG TPA: family 20 glycosylhydrolase [Planctomycetota bacterium]|nr:family 20 glycosylhydrolase [Planctomycetota bacterium]
MTGQLGDGYATELRLRGHAVLPAPRRVELGEGGVSVSSWEWGLRLAGVAEDDIAVRTFLAAAERHYDKFKIGERKLNYIELAIRPDAVETGLRDGRHAQAYRIEIGPERITLVGNARPGLFYAVQTYLQLHVGGLPLGTITDWPQYEIRAIHWDTKHHQDRLETLKRYLDQAAEFKINAILYELEDKFAYPSHPIIGAPGAWTTEQLQELTDYALERHIEIIPDVQSPAHLAYVLKHEEFARLRCDGSNYQICMGDPEARKLLFDMYDDVCEATKGVRFFHVSTDEVYYAGICERYRKPYNPENRSLTWVDYVVAAHEHLVKRGREIIVWAEYPLLPEHARLLPATLINGVAGKIPEQTAVENERGIRQFTYVPMQGGELVFPNYFAYTDRNGRRVRGRLEDARDETLAGWQRCANSIGTISAAWDDSGLHNECFWLGWAMMGQASWTPGLAVEQAVADFCDIFYGRGAHGMHEAYRLLQDGARFIENTLEWQPSKLRGPSYGNSERKQPRPRRDLTMLPPALPNPADLSVEPVFRPRYARALAEAPQHLDDNGRLLLQLQSSFSRVRRNHHNLEVFLSIAHWQRHFIQMILSVAEAEDLLVQAPKAERPVEFLSQARDKVRAVLDDMEGMYQRLKAVWEKSRFEKGRSVGGRHFVHIMDDVKDHFADRRPDLRYLLAPEENIGLAPWLVSIEKIIAES